MLHDVSGATRVLAPRELGLNLPVAIKQWPANMDCRGGKTSNAGVRNGAERYDVDLGAGGVRANDWLVNAIC